jgi:RNA polymerase-binding transcription factor DksA
MEKPLTTDEVRAFERRLRDLHSTLSQRLGDLEQESLVPGEEGELAQPYDRSLEEAGMDPAAEILGSEETLLYEVREALERIGEGSFGRCEACDKAIERERLEVVPHARMCVGCARQAETRGAS